MVQEDTAGNRLNLTGVQGNPPAEPEENLGASLVGISPHGQDFSAGGGPEPTRSPFPSPVAGRGMGEGGPAPDSVAGMGDPNTVIFATGGGGVSSTPTPMGTIFPNCEDKNESSYAGPPGVRGRGEGEPRQGG